MRASRTERRVVVVLKAALRGVSSVLLQIPTLPMIARLRQSGPSLSNQSYSYCCKELTGQYNPREIMRTWQENDNCNHVTCLGLKIVHPMYVEIPIEMLLTSRRKPIKFNCNMGAPFRIPSELPLPRTITKEDNTSLQDLIIYTGV